MKIERGRDQEQPGRLTTQFLAGEIAVPLKIPMFNVPSDAHPVIQSLEREMHVLGSFQLDHRQPSAGVDGEQVQHAAIGGRKGWNLAIYGRGRQIRIDLLDVSPDLGFEPGFRVSEIERIAAVGRIGTTQPGKFTGAFRAEPRQAFGTRSSSSELQPMYAKAQFAIAAVNCFYPVSMPVSMPGTASIGRANERR